MRTKLMNETIKPKSIDKYRHNNDRIIFICNLIVVLLTWNDQSTQWNTEIGVDLIDLSGYCHVYVQNEKSAIISLGVDFENQQQK